MCETLSDRPVKGDIQSARDRGRIHKEDGRRSSRPQYQLHLRSSPNTPDADFTRRLIVVCTLVISSTFLLGTGFYGLWTQDFSGLRIVLDYVELPIGTLFLYYFRTPPQNSSGDGVR